MSWGFSLTRERFNVRTNCNYRGRNRRGRIADGLSIEPGTYNWGAKYMFVKCARRIADRETPLLFQPAQLHRLAGGLQNHRPEHTEGRAVQIAH